MADKKILDATCGSRMMWFDKENPDALFCDIRNEDVSIGKYGDVRVRPELEVDFRDMPFPDNSFYLVVFDPPHRRKLQGTSIMGAKYGQLFDTWQTDILSGFNECMRVLKPNGTLIFKWTGVSITVDEILKLIPIKPLFGHTSSKHGKTIWMTFMK